MIHSSQRQHAQNDENLLSRCERKKKNVGPRSERGLFRWDATWASLENKSVLGAHASVSCLGGRMVLEYTHSFLKCLPSRVRISFCSSIWVGLGDSLVINRIWQKRQGRHCSFLPLCWINSSWGSRLPCCRHTQVALWKDSHGNEWKPPGNWGIEISCQELSFLLQLDIKSLVDCSHGWHLEGDFFRNPKPETTI